jgi:hypothetical protein
LDWSSESFEKRYSLKYHLDFQPIVQ